ncbi:hypothetical protein HDU82_007444 [Entophlyctis luteolus]|nr:hypothetical protein HDU82_007444 [Entophlyctis luteolus]
MSTLPALLALSPARPPRALVRIDAHASVAAALHLMRESQVTAVAVHGQKDHWIGAGVSAVLLDSDSICIGIVTVLDVLLYLTNHTRHLHPKNQSVTSSAAPANFAITIEKTRVADIVGQNPESLSLWVANVQLPLKLALEPLAKGVHRFLVPATSATNAGSNYQICTQSDIVSAIASLIDVEPDRFSSLSSAPISQFAAHNPVSVSMSASALESLEMIALMGVMAVPVVDRDGVLADTLSASDFRAVVTTIGENHKEIQLVQTIVQALADGMTVGEFLGILGTRRVLKGVVSEEATFRESLHKVIEWRIHRLWVVDGYGVPIGVLSLGDMIRAFREVL